MTPSIAAFLGGGSGPGWSTGDIPHVSEQCVPGRVTARQVRQVMARHRPATLLIFAYYTLAFRWHCPMPARMRVLVYHASIGEQRCAGSGTEGGVAAGPYFPPSGVCVAPTTKELACRSGNSPPSPRPVR